MISLFLGLSTANLLLLGIVFVLGWTNTQDGGSPTSSLFAYHATLGIAAGFLTCLTHLAL